MPGRSVLRCAWVLVAAGVLAVSGPNLRRMVTAQALHQGTPGTSGAADGRRAGGLSSLPVCTEYELPAPGSYPAEIAVDGQGYVWITERNGNRLGRFDPLLEGWEEYELPTPGSSPWGLAVDAQGSLWLAAQAANAIERFDPLAEEWSVYPVPTAGSQPYDVAVGASGVIWFTESAGRKLGRLELDGLTWSMVEYPVPDPVAEPRSIAISGDVIWFTDPPGNQIVAFDRWTHQFALLGVPTENGGPQDIAVDSTGNPWTTESIGNKIAVYDWSTMGMWFEYALQTPNSQPFGLALDALGAKWFTERQGNSIGRLSGAAALVEYSLPSAGGEPTGIVVDADGCVWYTAPGSNRIGRMCFAPGQYGLFLPEVSKVYSP